MNVKSSKLILNVKWFQYWKVNFMIVLIYRSFNNIKTVNIAFFKSFPWCSYKKKVFSNYFLTKCGQVRLLN